MGLRSEGEFAAPCSVPLSNEVSQTEQVNAAVDRLARSSNSLKERWERHSTRLDAIHAHAYRSAATEHSKRKRERKADALSRNLLGAVRTLRRLRSSTVMPLSSCLEEDEAQAKDDVEKNQKAEQSEA